MGTLSKIVGGGTPRKAKLEHNYDEDGTAWITPADLSGYTQTYIKSGRRSLSEIGFKNSSAKIMPKGTVLLSSRAPVGYCAIAANDISTNQGFKSILPSVAHEPRHMRYYLLASKRYLEQNASGTTFSELSGASVKSLLFPIAPLAEQERIVDKIDKLFSSIEAGERAIAQARAGVARYRKAILKAAVTGELTADWRDENPTTESAKDLLARILTARYEAWEKSELAKLDAKGKARPETEKQWEKFRGRYKAPVEPEADSLSELPDGWIGSFFHVVGNVSGGLTKNKSRREIQTKRPFLRVANVYANRFELDEVHEIGVKNSELDRVELIDGDILVVEGNGSESQIGRAAVWRSQVQGCVHQNHLIKIRPFVGHSDYYMMWLSSLYGRDEIKKVASSSSGLFTLSISKISGIRLPIPSEEEQAEIVSRVEESLSKADAVEATLDSQSRAAKALKQAILKTAFEGRLVPQNPNDEPASELLKRIKAAS